MAAFNLYHPLAVFGLWPLNDRAKDVVRDPSNAHFVSGIHPKTYLEIGGIPSAVNDGVTLATLGRHGDIHMEGASVARVQCAFEIDRDSRVVMLYDRSHNHSTQVHAMANNGTASNESDLEVFPFEYGRPRKVCVNPSINPVLGMCGVGRNLVLFRLVWPVDVAPILARRVLRYDLASPVTVTHLAKTLDDTETDPESTRSTRIHTPALGDAMIIRYQKWDILGEGSFGVVHRVLNVDTGRIMALKLLKRSTTEHWEKCQREVKILSQIKHPHILDLIWSQRWDQPEAEIFSGLKDGALNTLVLHGSYAASTTLEDLATRMCKHMLRALDALDFHGIVHRDLKPENIFYVWRQDHYDFQLGDFGLSNHTSVATSGRVGTQIFMAPEMYSGSSPQTHKVDVWSLFVTLLWTLDICGFQAGCYALDSYQKICTAVQKGAAQDQMAAMRPMAALHPDQRATAAQMLCKCFNGVGLTTPPDQVPAWQPALPTPPGHPPPLSLPIQQHHTHPSLGMAVHEQQPETDGNNWQGHGKDLQQMQIHHAANFVAVGPSSDVKMDSDPGPHHSATDAPGGHWAAQ